MLLSASRLGQVTGVLRKRFMYRHVQGNSLPAEPLSTALRRLSYRIRLQWNSSSPRFIPLPLSSIIINDSVRCGCSIYTPSTKTLNVVYPKRSCLFNYSLSTIDVIYRQMRNDANKHCHGKDDEWIVSYWQKCVKYRVESQSKYRLQRCSIS
jgi:hypothetical protein